MHINVSHLHVHIPRNVTSILHERKVYHIYLPACIHSHFNYSIASFPTVVLYNCGSLSGDDCSGCLGLSADYSCGYCQPKCNLNSLTCQSSVIQAPNFQQCGAVTVTKVSELYPALYFD